MKRLTKKLENGFYECIDEVMTWGGGIRQTQILGQLEDIEEELGVELITFFNEISKEKIKHFKNIYFRYKGKRFVIKELENDK